MTANDRCFECKHLFESHTTMDVTYHCFGDLWRGCTCKGFVDNLMYLEKKYEQSIH